MVRTPQSIKKGSQVLRSAAQLEDTEKVVSVSIIIGGGECTLACIFLDRQGNGSHRSHGPTSVLSKAQHSLTAPTPALVLCEVTFHGDTGGGGGSSVSDELHDSHFFFKRTPVLGGGGVVYVQRQQKQ